MSRGDDIAKRINDRLKWLEKNDNPVREGSYGKSPRFWNAGAYRAGRYVKVWYISYQGSANLTFDEAERYARYLVKQGGNNTHHQAFREIATKPTL